MKKFPYLFTLLLLCTIGLVVTGQRNGSKNRSAAKQESREVREERRAKRQAEMEHTIDSIVLAHSFQFMPNTMQQEISGKMNMLSNPNFEVGIWDGSADIFLPYIKGFTPPYKHILLNYTISYMDNYVTEQTENGWLVSFESNLYSASNYTFVFEINSKLGSTTLTLKNPWYESVEYTGTISKFY